jgi:predicted amidohydrolase YtcJ
MFQAYWDAGYQIHVHNNGDAGFDVLLASLEKAMARQRRTDHRTVLVHFGFSQPDQVAKWIKLGGIVSSNPYYVTRPWPVAMRNWASSPSARQTSRRTATS